MLNGYPLVNYGVAVNRRLIEAIDKPAIMLTGTAMPKLTGEIGFASGFSGYLGSGIAYTSSYIKEMSIEDGIRNYQYLDRLAALYQERASSCTGASRAFSPAPTFRPASRSSPACWTPCWRRRRA
jgi:methylaspartate mutase epsilon subunit